MTIEIYAISETGERKPIDDLYWFEENGVHDLDGEGHYGEKYTFEIHINGIKVYPVEQKPGQKPENVNRKPPRRPPANTHSNLGEETTYYKEDNRTIDYIIITRYNPDGSLKSIEKKEPKRK